MISSSFPISMRTHGIEPVDLETLLRRSDIVTLHVPLSETTRDLLDARRLAMLKESAVLINARPRRTGG